MPAPLAPSTILVAEIEIFADLKLLTLIPAPEPLILFTFKVISDAVEALPDRDTFIPSPPVPLPVIRFVAVIVIFPVAVLSTSIPCPESVRTKFLVEIVTFPEPELSTLIAAAFFPTTLPLVSISMIPVPALETVIPVSDPVTPRAVISTEVPLDDCFANIPCPSSLAPVTSPEASMEIEPLPSLVTYTPSP